MDMKPPAGSRIFITTNGPNPVIVIPTPRNPMAPITGFFLTLWLFAGVGVALNTASKILSGNGNTFLVFGWDYGRWASHLLPTPCIVRSAARCEEP
jgi:hypothetical protein